MNSTMSTMPIKNSSKRKSSASRVQQFSFKLTKTVRDIEEWQHTKNGLRVLFLHQPGTESVTVNVVYLVGSRHEVPGKTGIAHMLEHMLFKEVRLDGKIIPAKHTDLENKGALSNASTWDDRTNYYYTLPAEYFEDIVAYEALRMRNLVLRDKEFKPEQQNVLSEYDMYAGRPDFILGSAVATLAFSVHGYGHDTIGFRNDIANLTVQDLQDFYDRYYTPENAVVVVVGDVMRERVLSVLNTAFGQMPTSAAFTPNELIEPQSVGERRVVIKKEGSLSLLSVSFHAPRAQDPAWMPLYCALSYLADGRLSPLYIRLVESHLCSSIQAYILPSHDPHSATISATLAKNTKPEDVERIICEEIARVQSRRISPASLKRIQEKYISDTLFARDGTNAIARELTEYIAAGDWTLYDSLTEACRAVTAKDIMSAAQRYLALESKIVGTFLATTPKNS